MEENKKAQELYYVIGCYYNLRDIVFSNRRKPLEDVIKVLNHLGYTKIEDICKNIIDVYCDYGTVFTISVKSGQVELVDDIEYIDNNSVIHSGNIEKFVKMLEDEKYGKRYYTISR